MDSGCECSEVVTPAVRFTAPKTATVSQERPPVFISFDAIWLDFVGFPACLSHLVGERLICPWSRPPCSAVPGQLFRAVLRIRTQTWMKSTKPARSGILRKAEGRAWWCEHRFFWGIGLNYLHVAHVFPSFQEVSCKRASAISSQLFCFLFQGCLFFGYLVGSLFIWLVVWLIG